MTTSHWQAALPDAAPPADLPPRADVAVVGGGIAGVSTAYWLQKLDPSLHVVLVERARVAHGASGRNAGFLLQGTDADYAAAADRLGRERARRFWRLTQETRDGLAKALAGADVGPEATGNLVVAGDEAEDERLRRSAVLLREDGVAADYLAAAEVERRIGSRGLGGALAVPTGGMLNPARAARALAERSGATVVEGAAAVMVEAVGAGVRLVTERGALDAGRVVLALNAYLPQFVPALGGFVRPARAQALATAPQPRRLHQPVYSHEGYFYLRQLPTGEVLLGGARHLHREAEVGYEDAATEPVQASLEGYLREHFPDLAGAPVVQRWSGTMGFGADGLPGFGRVPDVDGAWWVGGFTGHGMGYGFRTARTVAAAVLGEDDPYRDLLERNVPAETRSL